MKFSRFNIVARTKDGNCLLSNSLSGAICVIPHENYRVVRESLNDKGHSQEVEVLIKDLKKGGFIVDDEVDEVLRVKYLADYAAYRSDYLDLKILPTEECNFRCAYCYESFGKGEMTEGIRKRVKLLVEKRAPYLKRLSVGWFGGEPLLAMDTISDLSETFLELKREFHFVYDSHITTNSFLLDKEMMLRLLLLEIKKIQVTIDGYGEEHDRRRKLMNGGGTFDMLLSNIKAIRDSDDDFRFTVRINFDRDNIESIHKLLDLLKEIFGGDNRYDVFFRPISNWVGCSEEINNLHLVPRAESTSMEFILEEEAWARGLSVGYGFKIPMLESYLCYAALPHAFVIGSDGNVYKCTVYFEKDINKVGYVDEKGSLKLDTYKMAQWVGYKGDDNSHCQKCALLPSCQGASCPAAHVIVNRRPCPLKTNEVKKGLCLLYRTHNKIKGEETCNTLTNP